MNLNKSAKPAKLENIDSRIEKLMKKCFLDQHFSIEGHHKCRKLKISETFKELLTYLGVDVQVLLRHVNSLPFLDEVWEQCTRWERRKNAVMFFSSVSKMNIDEENIKSYHP
jgi:hypothetical protein